MTVARPFAPCPTWCTTRHDPHPDDDPHWIAHMRTETTTDANVHVFVSMIEHADGTHGSPVIDLDITHPGRAGGLGISTADEAAHLLTRAAALARDIAARQSTDGARG